jgi:ELWxxDGT repeat protein
MGGALYFTRRNAVASNKYDLWKTEGSDATTVALATNLTARPTSLTVSGNTLFFWGGSPGYGQLGLWKSDGTAAGTTLVQRAPPRLLRRRLHPAPPLGRLRLQGLLHL